MFDRHANDWSEDARRAAVEKAERWTREQAERLGYETEEILAAIRRGWLPEEVEALAVAEADQLDGPPPRIRAVAERLRRAPIMPLVRDNASRRREKNVLHPSPCRMAAE